MKAGFTTLTKVLAICVSLSLLGGYVWYRQDAANKEQARLDAIREAREKAAAGSDFEGEGPPMEGTGETLLSSSKNPSRVLMPGSKRGDFEIDGETIDQLLNVKEGGIKDAGPILEQEPEDEERVLLPGSKYSGTGIDEVPQLEDIPIIKRLFKDEKEKPQPEKPEK